MGRNLEGPEPHKQGQRPNRRRNANLGGWFEALGSSNNKKPEGDGK